MGQGETHSLGRLNSNLDWNLQVNEDIMLIFVSFKEAGRAGTLYSYVRWIFPLSQHIKQNSSRYFRSGASTKNDKQTTQPS